MIGKRLFSADKWVGRYFHLREAKIYQARRRESIDKHGCPMNRAWVRIEWVSKT